MKRRDGKTRTRIAAIALALVLFGANLSPRPAHASCENPVATAAVGGGMSAANRLLLEGFQAAVKAGWAAIFADLGFALGERMRDLEVYVIGCHNGGSCGGERDGRFDVLWKDWREAMKLSTQQLSASTKDQTRQIITASDANQMGRTGRRLQKDELQKRIEIAPSDESCRFDTAAIAQRGTAVISKAVSDAIGLDFAKLASNKSGTIASRGAAGVLKDRFDKYAAHFCNPDANGGNAGCTPSALRAADANALNPPGGGTYKEANITPSRTLFGKYTIDMGDKTTGDAVNDMIFNITGYKVPETIPKDVLEKSNGKDQRQVHREYMTQMDAIVGLAGMVVADRAPGVEAPHTQALRTKMGASNAAVRPSEREIRQAKIEELWSPNYYVNLGDNATEITRKELYLQAFNVAQLYELIEKTEKIGAVYAVESGNLIDKYDDSRGDMMNLQNLRKRQGQ